MFDKFFTSVINKKEIYSLMTQFVKHYLQLNPLETQGFRFEPGNNGIILSLTKYKSIKLILLRKSILLVIKEDDDFYHYEYDYNNEYKFKSVDLYGDKAAVSRILWNYYEFWKEILSNCFNLTVLLDGSLQLETHKLFAFKQQIDSQIRDI